jgi:hypothetical protein
MALETVSRRSKDIVSDPIADAHEQRAQSEENDGDTNDDEFGSHGSNPGSAFVLKSFAPNMPDSLIAEFCRYTWPARAAVHDHARWIVHGRMP